MCGIAGIIGDLQPQHLNRIDNMVDALQHRGPDARGVWISSNRQVAFGHRRLSIQDLSEAGAQPMFDPDSSVCLVFNGEIYNFKTLRATLESRGAVFSSGSDTEVLLRAYCEYGSDCLHHIEGMFSFAFYDAKKGTIFLARDRSGQKPLYFMHGNGTFAFASEIKALLQLDLVSPQINKNGLEDYLTYGYTTGKHTLIKDIYKLHPGECLTFDIATDSVKHEKYWSIPVLNPDNIETASIDTDLESILSAAVKRHLVADVPVGILLSGGLDSSLITALAARESISSVRTFTAIFPGQGQFDESPFARLVADHFGTVHTEIEVEQASPDILEHLAYQFDDLIADNAIVPMYLLARAIREHATVALGGDGGDELFAGYPHHFLIQKQQKLRSRIPSSIRSLIASGADYILPPGTRGRNHLIGLRGDIGEAIAHINMYFDAQTRAKLLGRDHANKSPELTRAKIAADEDDSLQRAMLVDYYTTLPEGYLAKTDRASMLTSLEMRAPFLDDQLVDFAWRRIPITHKASATTGKLPLRRLAKTLLPSSLDINRKRGMTMPLASWFSGAWGEYIKDILLSSKQNFISHAEIARLIKLQQRGYANQNRLFALTMLTLWQQEHKVSTL
ncbi:MAG: asparagine synthase (glutamine-hydrolyzing) [Candidatus Thiodiazotropha sp.]